MNLSFFRQFKFLVTWFNVTLLSSAVSFELFSFLFLRGRCEVIILHFSVVTPWCYYEIVDGRTVLLQKSR